MIYEAHSSLGSPPIAKCYCHKQMCAYHECIYMNWPMVISGGNGDTVSKRRKKNYISQSIYCAGLRIASWVPGHGGQWQPEHSLDPISLEPLLCDLHAAMKHRCFNVRNNVFCLFPMLCKVVAHTEPYIMEKGIMYLGLYL